VDLRGATPSRPPAWLELETPCAGRYAIESCNPTPLRDAEQQQHARVVNLASKKLEAADSSRSSPYGVVLVGGRAFVSNWGGRHPASVATAMPLGCSHRLLITTWQIPPLKQCRFEAAPVRGSTTVSVPNSRR